MNPSQFKERRKSSRFCRLSRLGGLLLLIFWIFIAAMLPLLNQHRSSFHHQQYSLLLLPNPTKTSSSLSVSEPQIAWLMSFPNSGTSYTLDLVRQVSQTVTASNYGKIRPLRNETDPPIPVYADQPEGPFWTHHETVRAKPPRFILTKTHCATPCVDCPPDRYVHFSFDFLRQCLTSDRGSYDANGHVTFERVEYSSQRVKKVIHLLRDPLDNVVARFRYERGYGDHSAANYSNDRAGFRQYCRDLNRRYQGPEKQAAYLPKVVRQTLAQVPCRAEFIRYVDWHNQAFSVTHDLQLEYMIVYYEDYETRFEETLQQILKFLELTAVATTPLPFQRGKHYQNYFTSDEQRAIRYALQYMSLQETWQALGLYFEKNKT